MGDKSELLGAKPITRREAITTAAVLGATLAWPFGRGAAPRSSWQERRDCYPQGVASGDPTANGMILWTRRPPVGDSIATRLAVEIATDEQFHNLVAGARSRIDASTDWTCRILVDGLAPGTVYWYRFTDQHGFGSRVGRTITAPRPTDDRAVAFAFVSCQNVQQGACNAYRRMIWEDERRSADDQLAFVLHLGDFVYEIVWYPEDRPQGMYARRLRDIVRYANGERHADFHIPTTLEDYRSLYRAYLLDPDLQDARARFPFVCMPDNHEFSWKGWQSQENFEAGVIPAQTRKVAANQTWFEYQPARVVPPGGKIADRFRAPHVTNASLDRFDDHGLGIEASNLAAIGSLTTYRALRWGRHVELLLTDNRSFRSEPLSQRPDHAPFQARQFPAAVSEDVTDILDAGRSFDGGKPPATISYGGHEVANPRQDAPAQSMLGARQKRWFLDRLASSNATWKVWGNSVATLDWRIDFQNLPADIGVSWPDRGFALLGDDDWSGYRHERREIFDFIRDRAVTGVTIVCGDRHAFLAGVASATLPPKPYHPVATEFVTGSISAPGLFEAMQYNVPKDHPLRPLYVQDGPAGPKPAINFAIMHGVRATLALHASGDVEEARKLSNPQLAPELAFADVGGHGYSVVRATGGELTCEFVCLPRPIERSDQPDGGPLVYRLTHRVRPWTVGTGPALEATARSGSFPLG